MHANTVSVASTDTTDDLQPQTAHVLAMAREALVEVFGSQKAAALTLGVAQQDLSRMLNGTAGLPLSLMARNADVLTHFAAALAKHCGFAVRRSDEGERRRARIAELQDQLARLWQQETDAEAAAKSAPVRSW